MVRWAAVTIGPPVGMMEPDGRGFFNDGLPGSAMVGKIGMACCWILPGRADALRALCREMLPAEPAFVFPEAGKDPCSKRQIGR